MLQKNITLKKKNLTFIKEFEFRKKSITLIKLMTVWTYQHKCVHHKTEHIRRYMSTRTIRSSSGSCACSHHCWPSIRPHRCSPLRLVLGRNRRRRCTCNNRACSRIFRWVCTSLAREHTRQHLKFISIETLHIVCFYCMFITSLNYSKKVDYVFFLNLLQLKP